VFFLEIYGLRVATVSVVVRQRLAVAVRQRLAVAVRERLAVVALSVGAVEVLFVVEGDALGEGVAMDAEDNSGS
jgi:hypothetical protein